MKAEEREQVLDDIEYEGFFYTFMHLADYNTIEDYEFHRLRNAFIAATKNLAKYVGCDEFDFC